MPVIPVLAAPRQNPTAARLPFQRPATSNLAFGGGEARALSVQSRIASNEAAFHRTESSRASREADVAMRAAASFDKAFKDEQQRQSNLEVLKAKDALGKLSRQVESDVFSRRGENADGATSEIEQRLQEFEAQVMSQSSSGTRLVLQQVVGNARRDLLGRVSRHERKEREGVEKVLHEANTKHALDLFTSAGVYDDGTVNEAHYDQFEFDIKTHVRAQGRLQGLPKEVVDENVRTVMSKGVRARISRLVGEGQGMLAKRMLEKNGDLMTEEDEAAIESQVRKASVSQEAQDTLDGWGRVSLGEAVKRAQGIKDEALRTEVIQKARMNHSINEERRRVYERGQRRAAWAKAFDPSKGEALSPEQAALLGGPGVRQWELTKARVASGLPVVSDETKKDEFNFLTAQQLRDMPIEVWQTDWAPYFDDSDRDHFRAQLRAAKQAKAKSLRAVTGLMTRSTAASQMVQRLLDNPPGTKPSSKAEKEQEAELLRQVDEEIVNWEAANRKKADATILPQLIANVERGMVRTVGVTGGLLGTDLTEISELTVDTVEDARVPVDRIPARELADLRATMKAAEIVVDDPNLERLAALYRIMNDKSASRAVRLHAYEMVSKMASTRGLNALKARKPGPMR